MLFLLGCIPIRILLAILVKNYPNKLIALPLLIIAIGFIYLYITNSRLNAPEATNNITWWANMRIYHGLLYLMSGILILLNNKYAYIPLAVDVLFGLFLYIQRNINN